MQWQTSREEGRKKGETKFSTEASKLSRILESYKLETLRAFNQASHQELDVNPIKPDIPSICKIQQTSESVIDRIKKSCAPRRTPSCQPLAASGASTSHLNQPERSKSNDDQRETKDGERGGQMPTLFGRHDRLVRREGDDR